MENSVDTKQEGLNRLVQWFEAAEDSTADSRASSEKCRDYYDGKQWTAAEEAALKKRKQPIIVSNRIKPKINTLKGLESKSRTNPKALPRNQGFDEEAAEAAQDSIRYVLDDNQADQLLSECFDELIIEGTEAVEINVQPAGEEFDITIRQIRWDRQFSDPHSREKSFVDAKYLGEVVWLDQEDAVAMYPEAKDVISVTMAKFGVKGQTYDDKPQLRWADGKRKRVCLISICYKELGTWKHAIFVRGGYVQEPQPVPFKDADGNSESMYVYQSAYVDRDGNRYGAVKDWLSQQDEINKRRSKALHLLSVRQAKVSKGGVDSLTKLREELAKPDGVIEENIRDSVQLLNNNDMAQAQFQLLAEAKAEIDGMGVNPALGGTDQRVQSGRALEAKANSGSNEVQPILDSHQQFKNRIYRAIWNRIRQYWTEQKWVRVTDNERNIKFVGLNQPVTMFDKVMERAKGQNIDPQMLAQLKSDPQMQQIVGTKNAPAEMDVDIILDEVPDFAALQSEQFAQLSDLAGKGMPIPPEAIIQASSLRDKEKILKMMRGEVEDGQPNPETVQAQQQIQQLSQALEGVTQENEQMKVDQSLKAQEVNIKGMEAETKAFEARTDRMRMERESTAQLVQSVQGATGEPGEAPEAGEMPEQPESQELAPLVQMLAQAMQEQSDRQAQMHEQLIMAVQESGRNTQQSIEQMAQLILAERQQPKTVRLSSGKVIEINPSGNTVQVSPVQ